jgi:antitoxin (DNA-binding transcriptional repressor) of toxin-antitoxin stability system
MSLPASQKGATSSREFGVAEWFGRRQSSGMKTVTKQEVVRGFDRIADLAHAGETVVVTHEGKPWIKLVPAFKAKPGKSAAAFRARLNRIAPEPIPGASEVLQRLRR